MVSTLRPLAALAGISLVFALVTACGSGEEVESVDPMPVATPSPTATPSPEEAPQPAPPTELKVAYINLMSPITLDANNPAAAETFEGRLEVLIAELKALNPDIIGFSEASWTRAHGSATERLAKALRMEFQYVRANPWFPGQTKAESDLTAQQVGFEEGELILSRYPILRAERRALNPRTSETEVRAALHAVIRAPGAFGEIDAYVARLSGGEDRAREAQMADLASFIAKTRGSGPLVFMGDLGEPPGSPAFSSLLKPGLIDPAAILESPLFTCCRDSVLGEQPPVSARTDYLLSRGWVVVALSTFGAAPSPRPYGPPLYASDHNGIVATFALEAPD